jgi:AraC-like DNA-binding protein/mannose-6-phosphate isomerase-like protein (cupin superfamily)
MRTPPAGADRPLRRIRFDGAAKDPFPVFCELQRYRRGSGTQTHDHDCVELVYVVKGSGVHRIDDQPFPLIPGDLYVIGEGSSHTFTAGDGELHFYNLLLKPELFDERERRELGSLHAFARYLCGERGGARPKLSFSPPHLERLAALLERLSRECAAQAPGWRMAAKALFSEFLIEACRPTAVDAAAAPEAGGGPVASALAVLHERYTELRTVEELARAAGVSAGHLGASFRKRTGLTIHQYLAKLRVEHARALLEQTELSITDIALRSGFDDSGYLTRMFRRATGTSPREYRARLRAASLAATVPLRGAPPEPR